MDASHTGFNMIRDYLPGLRAQPQRGAAQGGFVINENAPAWCKEMAKHLKLEGVKPQSDFARTLNGEWFPKSDNELRECVKECIRLQKDG